MQPLDMNYVLQQVAEGNLTVDQINYLFNSYARMNERVDRQDDISQERSEVSSPGVSHPNQIK